MLVEYLNHELRGRNSNPRYYSNGLDISWWNWENDAVGPIKGISLVTSVADTLEPNDSARPSGAVEEVFCGSDQSRR